MGFLPKGVWIMDYCSFMGYGIHFSVNQLGGPKKVRGIREYGLLELWVKRELTVPQIINFPHLDNQISSTSNVINTIQIQLSYLLSKKFDFAVLTCWQILARFLFVFF